MHIHTCTRYGKKIGELDPEYCPAAVQSSDGWNFWQCRRKGKHEEEFEGKTYRFCKQHSPSYIKAKRDAQDAKWDAKRKADNENWTRDKAVHEFCEGIPTKFLQENRLKDILTRVEE